MSTLAPELERCNRELQQIAADPKADAEKAFLTTLGQLDWEHEKRLIQKEAERMKATRHLPI
jgi:hypothetical protein